MSTAAVSLADQPLYNLVNAPALATIADVIARMQAIDALLPPTDGLKWFNRLYLMVTHQVDLNPPGGGAWQSPVWLLRLDVVFAGCYFRAVAGARSGQPIPSAWSAMFEARHRTGIDRIQFALAGMNAHINRDLALALLATNADLNIVPASCSPEADDYQAVNQLLNSMMPSALTMLATDTLGVLAQDTGKVGRLLAFWDICRARDLAWDFSRTSSAPSTLPLTTQPSPPRTPSPESSAELSSPPPESPPTPTTRSNPAGISSSQMILQIYLTLPSLTPSFALLRTLRCERTTGREFREEGYGQRE